MRIKGICVIALVMVLCFCLTGCERGSNTDSRSSLASFLESSSSTSYLESSVESSSLQISSLSSKATSRQSLSGLSIGEAGVSINIEVFVTGIGEAEDITPTESGNSIYYVDLTIKNIGTADYEMSIQQRFHLLDDNRLKINVDSFISSDGTDLNGTKLLSGESVTGRALFTVPDQFKVAAFTYTFDINGFGIFTYIFDEQNN